MNYNPHDTYYKKAKQEGYRSRAAYKLLELQQRFRLMKIGDRVVDLGAAPGGWLQVAARVVGPYGRVIGVDLQAIDGFRESNIMLVQGDITAEETPRKIKKLIGGPAHSVISDLAPRLSGIRDADTARCLELNRGALTVATELLRPGGTLLIKSFINNELPAFTLEIKRHFRSVQRTRPEATRQGSSEFYFCAKDFRPSLNDEHFRSS
jgi:23S rRNA (uridine2552-2'-O)-methyltransferase